ncbi:MAG: shikimate kinase [Treponema sp.]|jgi:shikimate kinase|nr:shikimate kinase [Treponema sp.]
MEHRVQRIILITGPKHAGKSAAGQALADCMGGEFADLDVLVEKAAGKTPRALFREGPGIFRKAEARALASAIARIKSPQIKGRPLVIAAGGGLIDNPEAMELLYKRPEITAVYLEVSPETAWKRILDTAVQGELPPFLNTENPQAAHFELHTRRAAAYRAAARIIIDGENKNPQAIADEIAACLSGEADVAENALY